jgi:UDP-N-acetylmuramoylalanine--D-glutamate ligase
MAERALLYGFGVTNQAVADALVARGVAVVVADDAPSDAALDAARARGLDIVAAPDADELETLVRDAAMVLPSPGLGDVHAVIASARAAGVPVRSEFDLAMQWDDRPVLAITGTDGKTTVTTLTAEMLEASGVRAAAAGNTEVPLVAAIEDPAIDVFVVESSSFRLDHSEHFEPLVATWLNFGADHLDRHQTLESYELAKARIWRDQSATDWAVGCADDPVVMRHLRDAPAQQVTFGLDAPSDYRVADGELRTPDGEVIAKAAELWRSFPHDLSNALAAVATARPAGASLDGCRDALVRFRGLPHRISLVGESNGVRWFDDSKATTPGAALAAVRSFDSVVLIAGGRNKGLDLSVLASAAGHIKAVVAIGEAAPDVVRAFDGVRPVVTAASMTHAVEQAAAHAAPGDTVLLSPACASFDWYKSYGERGDDFARRALEQIGAAS